MNLAKKILSDLNGLRFKQEYVCFDKANFTQPLYAFHVDQNRVLHDVTRQHLFVGYSPLVFAFPNIDLPSSIRIILSAKPLPPNEIYPAKDALALLDLKLIKKQEAGNDVILYHEGTRGSHHFLSAFHQFINRLYNQRYNKKPGNVFLHDDLYRQVQIAYAIPRRISLITVGNNGAFNLFPTDLHGQLSEQHYIISLRLGGKACLQVEASGRILLSEMPGEAYKMVYGLGKNHMQDLKPAAAFPFGGRLSRHLQLPLPQQALGYRELELVDAFTHGIHKILLFRTSFPENIVPDGPALVHIHNSYATWRCKNGLPGNYLLR